MALPFGVLLLFTHGPRHPLTLVVFAAGILVERKVLSEVRDRVPTLSEFCHKNSVARRLMLAYGFVLSALAVWLLTRGQRYGYELQDYLPSIFALIIGPIGVALAAYQVVVFRALGEDDV